MELELLGKHILVAGLRSAPVEDPGALIERLRAREELSNVVFQLLDARLVAGREHLLISALNAIRAMELGLNVSSDLGIEILTFASGQRQISKAIRLMGLKPGLTEVAVVLVADSREELETALNALAEELRGRRDDDVLLVDEGKAERLIEAFGLGHEELSACSRLGDRPEAVKALVLEKVALSVAYR